MYVTKFDSGRVFKGKSARSKASSLVQKKKPSSTGIQSSTPTTAGGSGSYAKNVSGVSGSVNRTTSAGAGRRA